MILAFDRARYPIAYLLQRISEKQVQAATLAELHRLGITAWVVDAGAVQRAGGQAVVGVKGMSDIIGFLPGGRALFIEVKAPEWVQTFEGKIRQERPAGKLSPEQQQFLIMAEAAGCVIGVCWHPGDLAKILPR